MANKRIILFLMLLVKTGGFGLLFGPNPAEFQPKGPSAFYGETIRLTCVLIDSEISADSIFFKGSNGSHTWIVDDSNVHVDNRDVSVDVTITPDHIYRTTYMCFQRKSVPGSPMSESLLTSTYVYCENSVHNVTDFRPVVHLTEIEYIDIHWKLGVSYQKKNIEVSVLWSADGPPDFGTSIGLNCSEQRIDFCRIHPYQSQSVIFVAISVKIAEEYRDSIASYVLRSSARLSTTLNESFIARNFYLLNPPQNFRVSNNTAVCLSLQWDDPKNYYSGVDHKLIAKDLTWEPFGYVNRTFHVNKTHFELCGLTSNTMYSLSLQVKTPTNDYWSTSVTTQAETREGLPVSGPPMTSTSYWESDCDQGQRTVKVYWNKMKSKDINGNLLQYNISISNMKTIKQRPGMNSFEMLLDCNKSYSIDVYPVNSVGGALNRSNLWIPSVEEELQHPAGFDFKVELMSSESKLVNATWNTDVRSPQSNEVAIIVYWCEKDMFTKKSCFDDFMYEEVPLEKGFLALSKIPDSSNYFGYALKHKAGRRVSPIMWTQCIFKRTVKPPAPAGVETSTREKNSIFVQWTSEPCNWETLALVLRYHIRVCRGSLWKECHDTTVESGSKASADIKDLTADEDYFVSVQAESPGGKGPFSQPIKAVPYNHDLSNGAIVGIIMAVLVIITVAVVALRCHQRKRKMMKSFSDPLYTPFENRGSTSSKTLVSENGSKESGIGSSKQDFEESVSNSLTQRSLSTSSCDCKEVPRPICPLPSPKSITPLLLQNMEKNDVTNPAYVRHMAEDGQTAPTQRVNKACSIEASLADGHGANANGVVADGNIVVADANGVVADGDVAAGDEADGHGADANGVVVDGNIVVVDGNGVVADGNGVVAAGDVANGNGNVADDEVKRADANLWPSMDGKTVQHQPATPDNSRNSSAYADTGTGTETNSNTKRPVFAEYVKFDDMDKLVQAVKNRPMSGTTVHLTTIDPKSFAVHNCSDDGVDEGFESPNSNTNLQSPPVFNLSRKDSGADIPTPAFDSEFVNSHPVPPIDFSHTSSVIDSWGYLDTRVSNLQTQFEEDSSYPQSEIGSSLSVASSVDYRKFGHAPCNNGYVSGLHLGVGIQEHVDSASSSAI